ncbi:MAG: ABC transporter ATP-binding protein [Bryobacterales bacterium]|nr:ABC transporter ATP-binding protein [Bryobacterales bacterium]
MKQGVCWRLMGSDNDISFKALGLTRRYQSGQSELVVFAGLNLDVYRGERLALIGESGAGKSTLLHLLGGLDRPSEGTIFFETREISGLSDAELSNYRNREIGFVWQTHYLLPEFTALENVMMPLLIRNISQPEAAVAATRMLEEVGLKERATHRAGELSGGEQQRVALARALVGRPKALLADEPTGNLDFKTGEMIMDLLDELHRSHRLTSIYVTHNQMFAARCDRVLKLDKGELFSLDSGSQGLRE